MAKHTILEGKVHLYQRPNSPFWQCAAYVEGRNRRISTKLASLSQANDFAEDWYLELRGKQRRGELLNERTFKEAAQLFEREYGAITEGERS